MAIDFKAVQKNIQQGLGYDPKTGTTNLSKIQPPPVATVNPTVAANVAKVSPTVVTPPPLGVNVVNYNPNSATDNSLAQAGRDWWKAKSAGDTAGMNAAAAKGAEIRAGSGQSNTFDPKTGTTAFKPNEVNANGSVVAPPDTAYTGADVQSQIDAKIKAFQGEQEAAKQTAQFGIDTNKAYLQDQLNGLAKSEVVAGDSAQQLQNRMGGFYSGGLDYQMGGIQQAYAGERGTLSRDVASRNQQLLDQYGSQANTIASQIQNLQSSAPGIIADKIAEFKQKQADSARADKELALKSQDQTFNHDLATKQFNQSVTQDQIKNGQWDQSFDLEMQKWADQKGFNWAQLSLDTKKSLAAIAVDQQNAATSRMNAGTNAAQLDWSKSKDNPNNQIKYSYESDPEFANTARDVMKDPNALANLKIHASELMQKYGTNGYDALVAYATPKKSSNNILDLLNP
jgi:hypothetical protein